jgi:hypothetical protein
MAHAPGSHPKLKDPTTSQCQNDDGTKNHGEQQRYGQRQMPVERQEIELYALRVLKDEDQNNRQSHDPDYECCQDSTEARLAFARIVFRRLFLTRGLVRLLIVSRQRVSGCAECLLLDSGGCGFEEAVTPPSH